MPRNVDQRKIDALVEEMLAVYNSENAQAGEFNVGIAQSAHYVACHMDAYDFGAAIRIFAMKVAMQALGEK